MSDILQHLAKQGTKILLDTKLPKQSKDNPTAKKLPQPAPQPKDRHEAFVKKTIQDKPKKQVLIDFFQEIIEVEEKNL